MQNETHIHNGIQFQYERTMKKWSFSGTQQNGRKYTLITKIGRGANPAERARKVAGIVAGSLKRGYASAVDSLDFMAKGQLNKVIN